MNEKRWHILLIDDNPDDRVDLRQMLLSGSDRRYIFTEAELGAEGLAKILDALDDPYDCVLLDYHLPDMNAEEVLDELYKNSVLPTCPVVVITGSETRDKINGSKLLIAGAQDYIGKNWITPEGLTRAVENAVDRFTLSIKRDLTEKDLNKAMAATEKANLAKSEFLSNMSHELRTPLNAILGFAQLLDSGSPQPTPRQKTSIDQILHAGWYLLELINEILDLAIVESGKLSLSLEPISLGETLSDCQAMIEPQAENSHIFITFPRLDNLTLVKADQTRLKQVILNLLSNAIKYNRTGGSIDVRCRTNTADRIRISVHDTGEGLSSEQLTQLFQPFNRLGQEAGSKEGTGIGLVVCKRLVELMGGTIGVESTVGIGSEFWFELLLDVTPQFAADDTLPAENTPKDQKNAAPRTILYVEDNPANLLLVEQIVKERSDFKMLSAHHAKLGIELARSHQPDIIIMDVNLPGISGIQALKILREDPATVYIPVIAISANAIPSDIQKGLESGFFRYLTKPIKVSELMNALDDALKPSEMKSCNTNATGQIL